MHISANLYRFTCDVYTCVLYINFDPIEWKSRYKANVYTRTPNQNSQKEDTKISACFHHHPLYAVCYYVTPPYIPTYLSCLCFMWMNVTSLSLTAYLVCVCVNVFIWKASFFFFLSFFGTSFTPHKCWRYFFSVFFFLSRSHRKILF